MIAHIQPVETDGQFWVVTNLDGCELERRGPFSSVDAAEDMAGRLAAICRAMHAEVHLPAARAHKR